MQSLSTTVSADDGWQGDLGSDRRSLQLHFHTPYNFVFFNDTEDDVPCILQNDQIGKSALDSLMIFASHEFMSQEEHNFCECEENRVREDLNGQGWCKDGSRNTFLARGL